MRATTIIVMGFRNVGDAADQGDFFEGTLRDGLAWVIQKFATLTLARRAMIAVGRTRGEVEVGLDLKRGGNKVSASALDSLNDLLAGLGEGADDLQPFVQQSRDPQDDYEG